MVRECLRAARGLAHIAGQIVSMSKAIFPAKLLLRNVYRLLKSKTRWSNTLVVDKHSLNDLRWWLYSMKSWNGRSIADSCPEIIQIATNASALGYGGIVVNSDVQVQSYWDRNMSSQSSNMRETKLLILQAFGIRLLSIHFAQNVS